MPKPEPTFADLWAAAARDEVDTVKRAIAQAAVRALAEQGR